VRAFNAFQVVCLFASGPHVIGWLASGPFPYSAAAFWVAIAAYVVGFWAMTVISYEGIKD
jgi:hypothetical protein